MCILGISVDRKSVLSLFIVHNRDEEIVCTAFVDVGGVLNSHRDVQSARSLLTSLEPTVFMIWRAVERGLASMSTLVNVMFGMQTLFFMSVQVTLWP